MENFPFLPINKEIYFMPSKRKENLLIFNKRNHRQPFLLMFAEKSNVFLCENG